MNILDILIGILIIFWLGGLLLRIGGGLIHILLVVAVIVAIARFMGVRV